MKQSKTVAQLEKKIAGLGNHKKWYKKLLKELKKLKKLEEALEEKKASSKNLKKDYKNRLEELEDAYSRIAALNEDINVLKGTMKQDEEAFEIEIHELKNACAECGQEKEALTQKIETLSASAGASDKLKAKNDELKEELKTAKKSAKKSAKELEKLEEALTAAQINCEIEEGKVTNLEGIIETAVSEIEMANATISDLQDDHMRLTEPDGAEIEIANATISDLQDDHMRLTEPEAPEAVAVEEEATTPETETVEEETAPEEESVVEAEEKPKSKKEEALERIKEKAKDIDFERIGAATEADKDDLQRMKGIGPYIENKLNALGIYTFKQIANFTEEDKDLVNNAIEFFPGRIKRDDWVGQATELMGKG